MPNLPVYLPDPFARAAWAMRNGHKFAVSTSDYAKFWDKLAEWIESAGKSLARAGGNWTACDSPADVHAAHDIAQFYLAMLTDAERAEIPQDVHS